MSALYDFAIVGSGFAGSLTAMIVRRLGLSVVILERGRHPRFVIGESSTPLSNLLLEELANRYDLPIKSLTKWGSWQAHHPELACGLKRGFTFYHHELGRRDAPDPEHRNHLLVAASPHNHIADTHWYRSDFDMFLLEQARKMGANYYDETALDPPHFSSDKAQICGRKNEQPISIQARFVIDASGPRGFLHRTLRLEEARFRNYPATQALYSHFVGVKRTDEVTGCSGAAPYPIDDAAVHHIFEGGWIWALRFNNGRVSAGVAASGAVANKMNFASGHVAWHRLLRLMPTLEEQFADATAVEPFMHVPRLAFASTQIHGERWAMLPSTAAFVDPLLSTGFPLTLLGISRLANVLEHHWNSSGLDQELQEYAGQTRAEFDATARLVGALYANMKRFRVFTALSLLYFAAASFSEAARRLQKPQLAQSFLLHDHPTFGPACRDLLQRSLYLETEQDEAGLIADVKQAIEPLDVAGLRRGDRHNWYPADAEDLLQAAFKLGSTREEIEQLLKSCGFFA